MSDLDPALEKWLRPKTEQLSKATLGQLLILMKLAGAKSLEEIGGTNSRQKLIRLQEALGIGALTQRVGKTTKLTPVGERVVGEYRLFLQELRMVATSRVKMPTWIVGAGESWLQSVIIPTLAQIAKTHPDWTWEIRNMRSGDIRSGLKDGLIHFGLIRDDEVGKESGLTVKTRVILESYRVIAGNAEEAPTRADELIRWLVENKRPLVQQGSTWRFMREHVSSVLKLKDLLTTVPITIVCENHNHALAAVEYGNGWCVVPSGIARSPKPMSRSAVVKLGDSSDYVSLVHYPRSLRKSQNSNLVLEALTSAIRDVAKRL